MEITLIRKKKIQLQQHTETPVYISQQIYELYKYIFTRIYTHKYSTTFNTKHRTLEIVIKAQKCCFCCCYCRCPMHYSSTN